MFDIDRIQPGNLLDITLDDLAANAQINYPVPGDDKECLILMAASFNLVTDATVATRKPAIRFSRRSGGVIWELNNETGQAASLTYRYYAGLLGGCSTQNGGWSSTGTSRTAPLPVIVLRPGDIIETYTINWASGDQYTDIALRFLRSTPGRF
jgi:hypothetical protein